MNRKLVGLAAALACWAIPAAAQQQQQERMVVNADAVNLRTTPSINAPLLMSLGKGTEVIVLSREGGWTRIQLKERAGWVRSNLLTAVAASAPAPSQARQSSESATRSAVAEAPRQVSPPAAQVDNGIGGNGYKSPGTATLISVLVPGGGQIWTGETGRGVMLLLAGPGALIVGCGVLQSPGLCVGALLVDLAAWGFGIVDAASSARRMNAQHRNSVGVAPILVPGSSPRMGLALRMRF